MPGTTPVMVFSVEPRMLSVALAAAGALILAGALGEIRAQHSPHAPPSAVPSPSGGAVGPSPHSPGRPSSQIPGATLPEAFRPTAPPSSPPTSGASRPQSHSGSSQSPHLPIAPTQVPVDGGLGWLAAAGAAYAARRLQRRSSPGDTPSSPANT